MLIAREVPKLLSIVVPVYNEEESLPSLREQLTRLQDELLCAVEIILVDDGSADHTYALLHDWALVDPAVKVIALSRNFGHQLAITAGMDASSGDAVVIMDADLQDPPSLIPEMVRGYCDGYDVVYGQRTERDGETWFKRATAAMFYRFMRRVIDRRLPENTGDFRLVSRRVIEDLRRIRERDRYVRGIMAWVGFPQKALPYRRAARAAGTTKYPLVKMLRLALDAVVSFSDLPLRLVLWAGVASALVSLALLVRAWWLPTLPTPSTLSTLSTVSTQPAQLDPGGLAALVGLFGGAILVGIGVVGLYIARIHTEVRGRPLYLVRHAVNFEREPR
jgi:glycosyltransferase involved in cell wall biosynthesis